jgi:hypothetical protein
MRIRLLGLLFSFVLLGFFISPGIGRAQLVLYDDFNAAPPVIKPDKWHGTEAAGTATAPTTETIRKIVGKKLQLSLVFYGNDTQDTVGPSGGLQRLRFNDPSSITAIQAKVVVQKAEAQGCVANSDTAKARAQITGRFFNDGTGSGTDETGDVFATIEMQLDSDPAVGRRIRAFINRCTNADCSPPFDNVASATFVTTWAPGAARTLLLQGDPPNHQFIFTVNPGAASEEIITLPHGLISDTDPPVEQSKELRVNGDPVNCTAARMRTTTTATFDNVMINPPPPI